MLLTNADSKVTPKMQADADKSGRRQDYIEGKVDLAQRAEREQGLVAPGVRFAWQRDAVFTEDTEFDNSREAIAGKTSVPIKEYVLELDGTLVKDIRGAALEALRQGKFCHHCEERQPEDVVEIDRAWKRRELHLGPAPDGCAQGVNCCYCLRVLGIKGGDTDSGISAPENITVEQFKLLATMGIDPERLDAWEPSPNS